MSNFSDLQAIELFTGTGGLSLGLHQSGWEIIEGIELDKWATETYAANFPDTKVTIEDVKGINLQSSRESALLRVVLLASLSLWLVSS